MKIETFDLVISKLLIDQFNQFDRTSDSFRNLVKSILDNGIQSPISIRKLPEDSYRHMIVDGAKRYAIAKFLGFTRIQCRWAVSSDHWHKTVH